MTKMKYDGLVEVLMRHEREHIIDAIMVSLRSFADVLGCSSRHVNFEDGGIEYVLVLHEVEEGRHWSEYIKERGNGVDQR